MTDLTPIIHAVQQAAGLTRRVAAYTVHASNKRDASPVTVADYGAQALICRAIATHFPDDAVVAEESGSAFLSMMSTDERKRVTALLTEITGQVVDEQGIVAWLNHGQRRDRAGRTWVIDPIDGTVGYLDNRHYAICVALMTAYAPTEAVMGLPRSPLDADGTLLFTENGHLFAAALDGTKRRQVGVSARTGDDLRPIDSYKIPESDHTLNRQIRESAGFHTSPPERYDSQLKYGMIAAGYADVFVRLPRDTTTDPHYIWDHATGTALLRAGGGQHTDLNGQPLDYAQGDALPHTGFIASNGTRHEQLVNGVRVTLCKP